MTDPAPIQLPTPPVPQTAPPPTALQKVENTVFTFLRAHYGKLVAAVVGFAASHFGVISAIIGKIL